MPPGQGYDGASNMKGEFNGIKSRILRKNPCAFYVHCFAYQLQLALVAVAKGNVDIVTFFTLENSVATIVRASCKHRDALREQLQNNHMEAFENDCLITGRGLNQETSLKFAGNTRWNSHYGTLISIISMFGSVVKVLEMIVDDSSMDNVGEENRSLGDMQSFEFVFDLFLMKSILGVTNDLSQELQKKDQEIVNAMTLVKVCKQQLQNMRENEFHLLLDQMSSFCDKHDIEIPSMDDGYVTQGRSRRGAQRITNFHHYHVELFVAIIDKQLVELNTRFDEVNTKLLLCLVGLSPNDSFLAFDEKKKLICFAHFYPNEFITCQLLALEDQLGHYILDMHLSSEFSQLKGIGSLAKKLVETGWTRVYNHVYLLITLALVLPVVTASVERTFSTMNIVKTPLRNRIGDQ